MTKEEQYNHLVVSYALDLACQRLSKSNDYVRPNWFRQALIEEAENSSLIKKAKEAGENND